MKAALILALIALFAQAAQAEVTEAQKTCIKNAMQKGLQQSAPGAPGCTALGKIPVLVIDRRLKHKGKNVLAEYRRQPGAPCGIVYFYVKSFTAPDGAKPQAIEVTDFCSPKGMAHAFYNGVHEGYHHGCPDVVDDPDNDDGDGVEDGVCEEIAVSIKAIEKACETVDSFLACFCGAGAGCEQIAADFPGLMNEDGTEIDPGKILEFAKGLCKAIDVNKRNIDRKAAFDCACGTWNSSVSGCQVPAPPQNEDGSSGCDGTPPTEAEAPNWPAKECAACGKVNSSDPCAP